MNFIIGILVSVIAVTVLVLIPWIGVGALGPVSYTHLTLPTTPYV